MPASQCHHLAAVPDAERRIDRVIGALIGGCLISPMVGAGTVNQGDFSLMGLLVSLGGAIVLLFVVNLVRRGTARQRVGSALTALHSP
ncbi:MAG: GlsB/YeaQ/YmgE family stress response membrane protein [Proteobacteria bacterium]|nr:GlsB/YeaQ/YmgE family stress response membrane protein [Pseudomonadota bacterium]